MLDQETKRKIDRVRDILVGKIPDPTAQVEQITTALIYKFMHDMDEGSKSLGGRASFFAGEFKKYSWPALVNARLSGRERLSLYKSALKKIPLNPRLPPLFRNIFKSARLPYEDPETLNLFLKEISGFSYDHSENLGNAFEYLLSILGSQGDAGQFRTPRHIIDFMVEAAAPSKEETVLDPACGTAGFLISAYRHIIKNSSKNYNPEKACHSFMQPEGSAAMAQIQSNGGYRGEKLTPFEKKQIQKNIIGYDISSKMVRLSLVNMYLHRFQQPKIYEYDTLTSEDRWDDDFDVILANPPFMSPKGGIRPHGRFSVRASRSEVLFVDYIADHLTLNGRAAVIVPEGVVFKSDKAYKSLRKALVENRILWAVASLPAKVFEPYSGVKTSILFLDKKRARNAEEILFLDIQNDGFDLGATRRKIDKNDLPEAFRALRLWRRGKKLASPLAHWVRRGKITEASGWSLTGSRYKTDIYIELEGISQNLQTALEPLSKIFSKAAISLQGQILEFQKTEGPKKITEGLKNLERKINHVVNSQEFSDLAKKIQGAVQKLQNSKLIKQMKATFNKLPDEIRKDPDAVKKILLDEIKKAFKAHKQLEEALKSRQKWPMVPLAEVLNYEQPTKYLVKSTRYREEYKTPVLTAGKSFILGFTNEETGVFPKKKLPVIIFDDFTTAIKFVNFPFKVKSSAMKILSVSSAAPLISTQDKKARSKNLSDILDSPSLKSDTIDSNLLPSKKPFSSIKEGNAVRAHVKFIFYMMKNIKFDASTHKRYWISQYSKIKIPFPPLEVQKEIAAEIERWQKIIDGARQIIKNWKPAIQIDPSWSTVSLGAVCKIFSGSRPKGGAVSKGILSIGGEHINADGSFNLSKPKYIPESFFNKLKRGKLQFRDVLIVKDGATTGKTGYFDKNAPFQTGAVNEHVFILRPEVKKIEPVYLYRIMKSAKGNAEILKLKTGAAQGGINLSIKAIKIPLPPLEIQKEIAAEIEEERSHIESCKKLIELNQEKIRQKINEVWSQK